MLPPANRLRKKKDIERVFVNKKYYQSGPLICKAVLNDCNTARFCFIVSKRISNKAVVRNRLKRQLRNATALFLPNIIKHYDCVLIACPGLENKVFLNYALPYAKLYF